MASRALSARTYTDTSYKVFTSPRRVRFKEQEYAIPRELAGRRADRVRALIEARDWRISFPIEVRVTPADDLWLSTAYGRDSAYLALHVYHRSAHEAYFAGTEALLDRPRAGGRTGARCTAGTRATWPPRTRCSASSPRCATSSTRTAGSPTRT